MHDVFNFEGDYYGNFLGFWSCEEKNMKFSSGDTYTHMNNAKFRDFRKHNKIGNDFVVLSKQKLIDISNNKQ